MTTDQLQTTLYERRAAEQQKFKSWLLTQPPDEILNHACEYSVREDILMELEPDDVLPEAQIRALLKSKTPLADVFQQWRNHQVGYLEGIRAAYEQCAEVISCRQQEKAQREAR